MNDAKHIGLDVHQATISVLYFSCKLLLEVILETKAETALQFVYGPRGSLLVTLEEGTCAASLHDMLKLHVAEALVCDPRKNALLKSGNKNDRLAIRGLNNLQTNEARASQQEFGWMPQEIRCSFQPQETCFCLTSPFIERGYRKPDSQSPVSIT